MAIGQDQAEDRGSQKDRERTAGALEGPVAARRQEGGPYRGHPRLLSRGD